MEDISRLGGATWHDGRSCGIADNILYNDCGGPKSTFPQVRQNKLRSLACPSLLPYFLAKEEVTQGRMCHHKAGSQGRGNGFQGRLTGCTGGCAIAREGIESQGSALRNEWQR